MIEYGITTSKAHYWLHVCPKDGGFYYYPRKWMVSVHLKFEEKVIRSARGRIAPLPDILKINGGMTRFIDVGYDFMDRFNFDDAETDLAIGDAAESCFESACEGGLMLLPVRGRKYRSYSDQIKGKDYACSLIAATVDVEVKGDFRGGMWGTGKLFVQTHEGTTRDGDRHDFNGRNSHVSDGR